MPYDFQRGVKIGAAAAGIAYFASGAVSSIVDAAPMLKDDKIKPVAVAALSAMAADALVQSFL